MSYELFIFLNSAFYTFICVGYYAEFVNFNLRGIERKKPINLIPSSVKNPRNCSIIYPFIYIMYVFVPDGVFFLLQYGTHI